MLLVDFSEDRSLIPYFDNTKDRHNRQGVSSVRKEIGAYLDDVDTCHSCQNLHSNAPRNLLVGTRKSLPRNNVHQYTMLI
jgi:hypothetical protein